MTEADVLEADRIARICRDEGNERINEAASAVLDDFVTEHRQELIAVAVWARSKGYWGT